MRCLAKVQQWGSLHIQYSLGYITNNKNPADVPGALWLTKHIHHIHNHPFT